MIAPAPALAQLKLTRPVSAGLAERTPEISTPPPKVA
jgi:hypothetical protein